MSRRFSLLAAALLIFSMVALVSAQTQQTQTTTTTVTKTVQNADGTYSVIEYPVGKEVKITLTPVTVPGANGIATILRDDEGTKIKLNVTGLPSDLSALNLYAVDQNGVVTPLGPITVAQGTGALEVATPLDKFMLVASPESNLTAYNPATVFFRSAVPEGFAVIPHTTNPIGEKVGASTAEVSTAAAAYTVPMLNIPAYKKGNDTKMKVNFSGALDGARVAVVSSGDPGIFAMAAAVLEVVDGDVALADVEVRIVPGLSAMQAAAARVELFFVTREQRATFRQGPGTAALRPGTRTRIVSK